MRPLGWAGGDRAPGEAGPAAALLHPSGHSLRSLTALCTSRGERRKVTG